MTETVTETWHSCYDLQWAGILSPAAHQHPAKMSRALVKRIFDELALPRGSLVVDPFGGIGSTGIEASSRGIRSVLVELEPVFVKLAEQTFAMHRAAWEHMGFPLPVIIQGDSRELRRHVAGVDCVISSPPFEASLSASAGIDKVRRKDVAASLGKTQEQVTPADIAGAAQSSYGTTEGQLGAMPTGSVDAVVSSPPFGSVEPVQDKAFRLNDGRKAPPQGQEGYGDTPGQLGTAPTTTFWEAAAIIVAECHAILKPNGIAVFVTKDFIRRGQRIAFTDDWIRLCEAAGFVLERRVRASLVKEQRGGHLFEGEYRKVTKRVSFFRRLYEKKYPENAIDEEDVTFFRRATT